MAVIPALTPPPPPFSSLHTHAHILHAHSRTHAHAWQALAIKLLSPETGRLLFGLVLLDKFSGPLGGAALELALLALLTTSPHSSSRDTANGGTAINRGGGNVAVGGGVGSATERAAEWIPFAFLMTLRTAVETTSRPFSEWMVLPILQNTAVLGA